MDEEQDSEVIKDMDVLFKDLPGYAKTSPMPAHGRATTPIVYGCKLLGGIGRGVQI
jgi:hypothetical protein